MCIGIAPQTCVLTHRRYLMKKIAFISPWNDFCLIPYNELLGEELQKDVKNSKFEIFESALYMKPGSKPFISYCVAISPGNSYNVCSSLIQ